MTKLVRTPATYADIEAAPEYLVAEIIDGMLETHHHDMMHHAMVRMATIYIFAKRPELDCLHLPEMHFNGHVLVPDMAGWTRGKIRYDDTPWSDVPTPDWAMEIVYPHTEALDRGPKRRIYAEAGVSDLWLFNPKTKVLEAFRLESGRYVLNGVATKEDIVSFEPFPTYTFPLWELWDVHPRSKRWAN
jgi:Uma2 family endonuclease